MRNQQATQLLFELSRPGRRAARMPACDVPKADLGELLPEQQRAKKPLPLPELAEPDIVRHFTNLSTLNMSVDTHFYPLGSCTMKYNPKRNERLASLAGIAGLHPYQPDATVQGMLQLLYELERMLGEIAGLEAVSLQPAAGAHGELTALMVAAAYFRELGQQRTKVLVPDSAHGTNPASAAMAGFDVVTVKSTATGYVDQADLVDKLDEHVAVFMITNPSTLGMFERRIGPIAEAVHAKGGLIYLDGANMNAILGITRPGDFGADMMHYNPHKTFSGPHGGGGPGAGPIAVTAALAPYLPGPRIYRDEDGAFSLVDAGPRSIGRVRSFFGNVGVLVRAYCYILTHGPDGLRQIAENAVLNANYVLSQLKDVVDVPQGERCMHEFVASAARLKAEKGVSAMDVAKRLLDFGFHAPTVYFPLIVPEALMIEPTETESKETLDEFVAALRQVLDEQVDTLKEAPHTTMCSRPNEVQAARQPVVSWS
ncbi:MAG: aminomethyl-transferring glycine dehydrogenase subunit GcvPB [Pirellulales bacterium]